MNSIRAFPSSIFHRTGSLILIVFLLLSCQASAGQPTAANSEVPPRPAGFQTSLLNPLDRPHTYVRDYCAYLRNRLNPFNAAPGTIVIPIRITSIYKGQSGEPKDPNGVDVADFDKLMDVLKFQGFEAISTKDFLAFMERNIKIPRRSILIIQDGSQSAEYLFQNYHEYWERWKWPVINGWVGSPEISANDWKQQMELEKLGWVDHQPEGLTVKTILSDESSKAVITRELQGPLEPFGFYFAKKPLAYIWQGGGFGQRPVEAARQLGYQLGFTANPRGPVMYNWVPLADVSDPARPTMKPEGQIGDPLMTLPRFTPYELIQALDTLRAVGREAAAHAEENRQIELDYYQSMCFATHGPIPSP